MKKMHTQWFVMLAATACLSLSTATLSAQQKVIDITNVETTDVVINNPDYPLLETYGKEPEAPAKFQTCTCNPLTSSAYKSGRAGVYVSLAWAMPAQPAGITLVSFNYTVLPYGGGFVNGTTGGNMITVYDNNTGGSDQIQVNCKVTAHPNITCTSTWKNGTFTSGLP